MNWWWEVWNRKWMIEEVIRREEILRNLELSKQDREDLISEIIIGAYERMIKSPFSVNSNISLDLYMWNAFKWECKDRMRNFMKFNKVFFIDPSIFEGKIEEVNEGIIIKMEG